MAVELNATAEHNPTFHHYSNKTRQSARNLPLNQNDKTNFYLRWLTRQQIPTLTEQSKLNRITENLKFRNFKDFQLMIQLDIWLQRTIKIAHKHRQKNCVKASIKGRYQPKVSLHICRYSNTIPPTTLFSSWQVKQTTSQIVSLKLPIYGPLPDVHVVRYMNATRIGSIKNGQQIHQGLQNGPPL